MIYKAGSLLPERVVLRRLDLRVIRIDGFRVGLGIRRRIRDRRGRLRRLLLRNLWLFGRGHDL